MTARRRSGVANVAEAPVVTDSDEALRAAINAAVVAKSWTSFARLAHAALEGLDRLLVGGRNFGCDHLSAHRGIEEGLPVRRDIVRNTEPSAEVRVERQVDVGAPRRFLLERLKGQHGRGLKRRVVQGPNPISDGFRREHRVHPLGNQKLRLTGPTWLA